MGNIFAVLIIIVIAADFSFAQTTITIDLTGVSPDVSFTINGNLITDAEKFRFSDNNTLIIKPHNTKKHLISLAGGGANTISISEQSVFDQSQTQILSTASRNKLTWTGNNQKTFEFENDGSITGESFKIPYPLNITIFELTEIAGEYSIVPSPVYNKKEFGSTNDTGGNKPVSTDLTGALILIKNDPSLRVRFNDPYDVKNDKVYLFFFRDKLISKKPVNIDEDDEFIPIIIALSSEIDYYNLNIIEGEYSPLDLAFRPFDPIDVTEAIARAQEEGVEEPNLVIHQLPSVGPFTTERFRFTINRFDPETREVQTSETYSFKINNLYHIGVGVSLIRTSLTNPEFVVAPLPDNSGSTIIVTDDSPRTMITFNVIWYWTVFQNPAGSTITKGRDVLKDEEAYTIRRVFPTVGVSLNEDISQNFFGGFVYEFARGGSIIAGGHYGRQQVLADRKFVLGETVFSGTNNDIILSDKYRLKFFIGVNVDTRVVNALFGRGRASE